MGRPRTIHIDADAVLVGIAKAYVEAVKCLRKPSNAYGVHHDGDRWERIQLEANGVRYDAEQFAGKPLSDSERLRVQQAIRVLGTAGLVAIYGERATRLKPTAAGWAKTGLLDPFTKKGRK